MPVTQILAAAGHALGGPAGSYVWNGTPSTHLYAGGITPSSISYSFPDTSRSNVLNFTGGGWVESDVLGTVDEYYLDFWFWPTAANVAIFSETDVGGAEANGYHYNMIEIRSDGKINAGTWTGTITYVTSNNPVTLNAWNHIYFYYSANSIRLELNGSSDQVNQTSVTRDHPSASYFGVGMSDWTYITTSNRYQGFMDSWYGGTTVQSSRYTSTKAKYGY